jgi:hypothetical protein
VLRHLVARTTRPDDAAERYYCLRTRRTLWVEPESLKARSCEGAPRYLVDNGDGSRTFYSGEDFSVAMERLLSVGKPERHRTEAVPLRLAVDVKAARSPSPTARAHQSERASLK